MVTSDAGDISVAMDILTLSSVQMVKVVKKTGEEGGKAGASLHPVQVFRIQMWQKV